MRVRQSFPVMKRHGVASGKPHRGMRSPPHTTGGHNHQADEHRGRRVDVAADCELEFADSKGRSHAIATTIAAAIPPSGTT